MPTSRISICICAGPFHPSVGGIEEISRILAVEFVKCGHRVEILTTTMARSENDDAFPFVITRTTSAFARWRAFRRCDVALFMNVSLNALPIAVLARCKVVLSHHGIYRFEQGSVFARFLETLKRQMTRFFPNISVSRFVARAIPGTSEIVPNAYDNVLFHALPKKPQRDFVFCGRLVTDKGVDVLLHAFAEVLDTHPTASLTIIGDGPERPRLELLVREMRTQGGVDFRGTLRGLALADALREHRCMVIPSIWEEPFGIVALEGIACCETVIAARRGGLPDAVGPCGLIVEPTWQSFANAMKCAMLAKENGEVTPGKPTLEVRNNHLKRHRPAAIALGYLKTCNETMSRN